MNRQKGEVVIGAVLLLGIAAAVIEFAAFGVNKYLDVRKRHANSQVLVVNKSALPIRPLIGNWFGYIPAKQHAKMPAVFNPAFGDMIQVSVEHERHSNVRALQCPATAFRDSVVVRVSEENGLFTCRVTSAPYESLDLLS